MRDLNNETMEHVKKNDLEYLQFKKLNEYNIKHCITTRLGGVSQKDLYSLNLSFNVGDDKENVLKNYEIICKELGIDYKDLILSKQVHNTNIRIVDKSNCGEGITKPIEVSENDAVMTNIGSVPLITFYADCVPIMFFEPQKRVIAMAHSGWKGTIAEISKKTISKMIEVYGINPNNLVCGIGPSIAKCCFEVRDDVARIFLEKYKNNEEIVCKNKNNLYNINLVEVIKNQLVESGALEKNIVISNICTVCNSDILYSHRATKGKTGRFGAIMTL